MRTLDGAHPKGGMAALRLVGKTESDEARRAVCVLLFRGRCWMTAISRRSGQGLKKNG